MDGKVIFCNDGVLRFQSDSDYSKIIPITLIQEAYKFSEHKMFLKILRKPVVIESGSTMGSFILCLEPWSTHADDYLDYDVTGYIKEIRKPSIEKNAFDKIEIRKSININRDLDYGERDPNLTIIEWLNSKKEPVLLNIFNAETTFNVNGYVSGDASNYSMTGVNIHQLKNVPLILNRKVYISEFEDSRTKSKGYVINENTEGVSKLDRIRFIETPDDEYFNVETIMNSLFSDGLFHFSPSGADSTKEFLTQRLENIKQNEERQNTELKLVEDNDEEKEKTIIIEENAFSSVAEHFKYEKENWEWVLSNIKSDNKYPVKIGKIKEDLPDEKRIFGFILDDENKIIKSMDEYDEKEED